MYNYKLLIQYDGGRYDGWQRLGKDTSENTIEHKIIEVINKKTGETPEIYCACRTEKGVHAYGQVANIKMNTRISDLELKNYFNRYLPRDIAILDVQSVDERFHSQLNAKKKTYVYRLDTANIADVFERKYAYHTFDKPDLISMRKASQHFVGSHDFKTFTTSKKNKSTVKNIYNVSINQKDNIVEIEICANDFLHNMARFMVGVLLDVGSGIRKPDDVKGMFENDKITMSLPAESYGLFLKSVEF